MTPSQRAREAAAVVMSGNHEAKLAVRAGEDDGYWVVQAFARFEAETLERAAEVADDVGAPYAGLREGVIISRVSKEIRNLIGDPQ